MGVDPLLAGLVRRALLVKLIGDVERSQDRDLRERGHRELLGDLAHLAIHVGRDLHDVLLVGLGADRIRMAEDLDLDDVLGVHGAHASPRCPC